MIDVRMADEPTVQAVNPAFEQRFGSPRAVFGKNGQLQESDPEWNLLDRVTDGSVARTRQRRQTTSGYRTVRLKAIPLADQPPIERVHIRYEDVTQQHRNREQLAVLHRILRHDFRNELNVIDGHTSQLTDFGERRVSNAADAISAVTDDLLGVGEAAKRLRSLETPGRPTDFREIVSHASDMIEQSEPAATTTVRTPPESIPVDSRVATGLYEFRRHLIERTDATPVVAFDLDRASESIAQLRIEIEQPQITNQELRALNGQTETALEHATGLSLWTVRWAVMSSNGSIEATNGGNTTVTLRVPLENTGP